MRLIVAIEDDFAIPSENSSKRFPESLKSSVVGNDVAIVAAKVVGVDDGIDTFCVGDIVDDACETCFVCCVYGAGHLGGDYSFHHDGNSCQKLGG